MTDENEPTTTKVSKTKKESKGRFDDLQRELKKLSPEDHALLSEQGYVIPQLGGITADGKVQKVYGYWCPNCNGIGLEFLGTTFINPDNGTEMSEPPLHIPIERLPWNQPRLAIHHVNRVQPICQECCCALNFEGTGRYIKAGYVRNLEKWAKSRLENQDRDAMKKRIQAINKGKSGDADFPRSYEEPDSNASTRIDPDTGKPFIAPERLEALKDVAAKTGLDDLMGGH